jgi:hypothetical protein
MAGVLADILSKGGGIAMRLSLADDYFTLWSIKKLLFRDYQTWNVIGMTM